MIYYSGKISPPRLRILINATRVVDWQYLSTHEKFVIRENLRLYCIGLRIYGIAQKRAIKTTIALYSPHSSINCLKYEPIVGAYNVDCQRWPR